MKILISDTHFGIKNNSLTWLESQSRFIREQLIPFVKQQKGSVSVYHLGDVMDSRSSINPYVVSRVRDLFNELASVCKDIHIIGGNHDYYSPESNPIYNVNSLDIIFDSKSTRDNIHVYTQEMVVIGQDLLIPWFEYYKTEAIEEILKNNDIKNIYVHNDLEHMDDIHIELFKGYEVYSGHIHTPHNRDNIHVLGSVYALTFADSNQLRGFYVQDNKGITFYPNVISIKFHRYRNEEILGVMLGVNYFRDMDYVELYVEQTLLLNDEYIDKIKRISSEVKNCFVIPLLSHRDIHEGNTEIYDIEEACRKSIPKELLQKFDYIVENMVEN